MSKAGYPYDNAPMERYFNTLKNELIYSHNYKNEKELYDAIDNFAYVTYNHERPHTYDNGRTPLKQDIMRREKSHYKAKRHLIP